MALNPSDIDKIAKLARLRLNIKEKDKLLVDLNKILEHMEIIDEIETDLEEKSAPQQRGDSSPKPNIVKFY